MKVKILKSDNKTTWYNDKIDQVIDVNYDIEYKRRCFTGKNGNHNLFNHDVVITELPESFCVKRCDDGIKWGKYIDWLNKKCGNILNGFSCKYYGVHKTTVCGNGGGYFGTEIHIDDMIKHIDYLERHIKGGEQFHKESQLTVKMDKEFDLTTDEGRLAYARKYYPIGTKYIHLHKNGEPGTYSTIGESEPRWYHPFKHTEIHCGYGFIYANGKWAEIIKEVESKKETIMETQKLTRQGLKEIYSVACDGWKKTLEDYGKRNPLEDYIELSQKEIDTMFLVCTKDQLPIVSKYLKQDDGSVDVTKFNVSGHGFCDPDFYIIRDRQAGKYKKKSFLLSSQYNWEIKTDELGELCLIPTKKK